MNLLSHLIALSLPNANPAQVSAALCISVAYLKKIIQ
jgi:hypothetical protein